jgi:hypothetical protein
MKDLSEDSWCPGTGSNQAPATYKAEALRLSQRPTPAHAPASSSCGVYLSTGTT